MSITIEEYSKRKQNDNLPPTPRWRLKRLGINPECPFASCPRRKNARLVLRVNNHRLIRRSDGGVEVHYNHYDKSNVVIRRVMNETLWNEMLKVRDEIFGKYGL